METNTANDMQQEEEYRVRSDMQQLLKLLLRDGPREVEVMSGDCLSSKHSSITERCVSGRVPGEPLRRCLVALVAIAVHL